MLVKVGNVRINLVHVARAYHNEGGTLYVDFVGGNSCHFIHREADQFLAAWDKWAQFQSEAQEINEYAIKENIAHIRAAQNKSGIVPVAAMPQLKRGRG